MGSSRLSVKAIDPVVRTEYAALLHQVHRDVEERLTTPRGSAGARPGKASKGSGDR